MFDLLAELILFLIELLVPDVFLYSDFFAPVVLILWVVSTIFYNKWSPNLKEKLKNLLGEKKVAIATDLYIIIRLLYIYISFISFSFFYLLFVAGYF